MSSASQELLCSRGEGLPSQDEVERVVGRLRTLADISDGEIAHGLQDIVDPRAPPKSIEESHRAAAAALGRLVFDRNPPIVEEVSPGLRMLVGRFTNAANRLPEVRDPVPVFAQLRRRGITRAPGDARPPDLAATAWPALVALSTRSMEDSGEGTVHSTGADAVNEALADTSQASRVYTPADVDSGVLIPLAELSKTMRVGTDTLRKYLDGKRLLVLLQGTSRSNAPTAFVPTAEVAGIMAWYQTEYVEKWQDPYREVPSANVVSHSSLVSDPVLHGLGQEYLPRCGLNEHNKSTHYVLPWVADWLLVQRRREPLTLRDPQNPEAILLPRVTAIGHILSLMYELDQSSLSGKRTGVRLFTVAEIDGLEHHLAGVGDERPDLGDALRCLTTMVAGLEEEVEQDPKFVLTDKERAGLGILKMLLREAEPGAPTRNFCALVSQMNEQAPESPSAIQSETRQAIELALTLVHAYHYRHRNIPGDESV